MCMCRRVCLPTIFHETRPESMSYPVLYTEPSKYWYLQFGLVVALHVISCHVTRFLKDGDAKAGTHCLSV